MLYQIYCDESRQTKDRYMILGGLLLAADRVAEFNATMAQFRQKLNMRAELKWTKVSTGKWEEYRQFVDYFFALNNTGHVHFHAILLDTTQFDHQTHNAGDKEVGFYKFYHQLLLHNFGRKHYREGQNDRFIVYLDERNTTYKLSDLKQHLNWGMNRYFPGAEQPFRSVEAQDSKASDVLQIADILLGAIGFQKNGYHLLAGSKEAKIRLADYIARQVGLEQLTEDTPQNQHRFTLWNFRLRPKKTTP